MRPDDFATHLGRVELIRLTKFGVGLNFERAHLGTAEQPVVLELNAAQAEISRGRSTVVVLNTAAITALATHEARIVPNRIADEAGVVDLISAKAEIGGSCGRKPLLSPTAFAEPRRPLVATSPRA